MQPTGSLGVEIPIRVRPVELEGLNATIKRLRDVQRAIGTTKAAFDQLLGSKSAIGLKFTIDKGSLAAAKAEIAKAINIPPAKGGGGGGQGQFNFSQNPSSGEGAFRSSIAEKSKRQRHDFATADAGVVRQELHNEEGRQEVIKKIDRRVTRQAEVDKKIQAIQEDSSRRQVRFASSPSLKHTETARMQGAKRDVFLEAASNPNIVKDSAEYNKRMGEASNALVAQQKALARVSTATADLDSKNRYLGRNMISNIKHVTAWTASVGILYGSLGLLRRALGDMTEIQYQQARLQQVLVAGYEGQSVAASKLTDKVLAMAAVNGRSAKEAMESSIQWARLGGTRVEVAEQVRVSLMAANVAELSAAEATERLSALTVVYKIRAQDLGGVLGMLNAVSNSYNVTNADMLDGMTKTASVAKMAGVPLSELIGIIGGTVGGTGQTGANIGNAIKSIIGRVANPDVQKKMREGFKFEATVEGGEDIKSFSEILREMYIHMNELNSMEKQSMMFNVAGRNQAQRMTAMLDNYVRTQILAVTAMQNMNSAERENALITDTMKSQFAGISTEFARFATLNGPTRALTEFAETFKNVLGLMNAMPGITTTVLGLLAAFGARLALTSSVGEYAARNAPRRKGEQRYMRETLLAGSQTIGGLGDLTRSTALGGGLGLFRGVAQKLRPDAFPFAFLTGADNSQEGYERMLAAGRSGRNPNVTRTIRQAVRTQEYQKVMAEGREEYFARTGNRISGKEMEALRMKAMQAASATNQVKNALTGVSFSLKALGLLAAVGEMALLAGAVYLVSKAFNALYDQFGRSDKVNQVVGKLKEGASFAAGAADAAQAHARLIRTVYESAERYMTPGSAASKLGNPKTIAHDIAAAENIGTEGRIPQVEKEINAILKLGKIEDLKARQSVVTAKIYETGLKARISQYDKLAEAVEKYKDDIRRLEASPFLSRKSKDEGIKELQLKIDADKMEQAKVFFKDMEDFEQNLQDFQDHSLNFKVFTSSVEGAVDAFRSLSEILPGDSMQEGYAKKLNALQMELTLQTRIQEIAKKKLTEVGLPNGVASTVSQVQVMEARLLKLSSMLREAKESVMEIPSDVAGGLLTTTVRPGNIPFIQKKRDDLAKEFQDLQSKIAKAKGSDGTMAAESVDRAGDKSIPELKAKIERLKVASGMMAELQDRAKTVGQLFAGGVEGAGMGETSGQQMSNQLAFSQQILGVETARLRVMKEQGNLNPQQVLDSQVIAASASKKIEELKLQAQNRLLMLKKEEFDLDRERNRENAKALMTAGPAQILKMLAIQQMGQKGMNAGSFFAMSQDTRQTAMQMMPQFDDRQRKIDEERASLNANFGGEKTYNQFIEEQQQQVKFRIGLEDEIASGMQRVAGTIEAMAQSFTGDDTVQKFSKYISEANAALDGFIKRLQPGYKPEEKPESQGAGLPHKAGGGDVKKRKRYWVGERGPEEFVPEEDGVIVPTGGLAGAGGAAMAGASSFDRSARYATAMASRTGTKAWGMMTTAMDAERIGHTATETAAYARAAQLQAQQARWASAGFSSAKWAKGMRVAGNAAAGLALAKEGYDAVSLMRDFNGTTGRYADEVSGQGLGGRMWTGSGNGIKGIATLFAEKIKIAAANSYSGSAMDWTGRPNSAADIANARRDRDARMRVAGISPASPALPIPATPAMPSEPASIPAKQAAVVNSPYGPPTYRNWAWDNAANEAKHDKDRRNIVRGDERWDDQAGKYDDRTARGQAWARQREESNTYAANQKRNRENAKAAREQEDREFKERFGYEKKHYVPPPVTMKPSAQPATGTSTSSTPATTAATPATTATTTAASAASQDIERFAAKLNAVNLDGFAARVNTCITAMDGLASAIQRAQSSVPGATAPPPAQGKI